jgi:ligand-binding sensor domain-containing protein
VCRAYFLSYFLLLSVIGFTQNPYHQILNIKDGLPSNEVHDIYVDSLNQIWITSDRGVSIYDGYKIKTFTTKDGLAYNTNFKIIPDDYNRLWFTGYDGSLSYYEDGNFHSYAYNEVLRKELNYNWALNLNVHENNSVTIVAENFEDKRSLDSHIRIDKNGNLKVVQVEDQIVGNLKKYNLDLYQHNDPSLDFYYFKLLKLAILDQRVKEDSKLFIVNNNHYRTSAFKGHTGNTNSHIFSLEKNKLETFLETPHGLNDIYFDYDNNIIICSSKGLLVYNSNSNKKYKTYFKEKEFTSIVQDRERNYWASTLNDGVYFIPSFEFDSNLTFKNEIINLEALENNLIIGSSNQNIYSLAKNSDSINFQTKISHGLRRFSINEKSLNVSGVITLEENEAGNLSSKKHEYNVGYRYNIGFNRKNGDKIITMRGMSVIQNEKFVFSNILEPICPTCTYEITSGISLIKEDHNEQLFFATLDGLYSPVDNKYEEIRKIVDNDKLLEVRIQDLIIDKYNNKWIATLGNGLLWMNEDLDIIQVSSKDGLNSEIVQAIEFENDSTLWVGTNKGLDKLAINYTNQVPEISLVNNFNNTDGLPTNFINALKYWDDKLWIGSSEGLVNFNTDYNPVSNYQPKVILDKAIIEKDSLSIKSGDVFDYNQNNILFSYRSVSYRKPEDDYYSYAITKDGDQNNWIKTDQTELRITNLPSATYTFKLKAKNKYGIWSETKELKFTIKNHFSQTWWFRLIMTLIIGGILYLFYRRRIRKIREEENLTKSIEEAKLQTEIAELTTFRNQFNPHFIFNILNSIQSSIVNNDIRQAVGNVSSFGKLMRTSLNLMKNKYVRLSSELDFLKSYIELEFLRFPDKFDFKIDVEDEIIEEKIFLPPLLFQPAIENVLKHAFNDAEDGLLLISIKKVSDNSALLIQVIDNGSGIDTDPKKERDSFGLKLIEDRIKLLNIDYSEIESHFKIYDNKEGKGTTAELQIPIIEKKP